MTKVKGQVASYAPTLGRVLFVALGTTIAAAGGPATAGSCTSPTPGNLVCSGPADPSTDVGVDVILSAPVTVNTTPGFGLDANVGGNAFDLFSQTGIVFTDTYGSSITSGTNDALRTVVYYGGDLSITTTGTLNGANFGIYARHYGRLGEGAISITAADVSGAGSDGIFARNDNSAGLNITTSGTVTGARRGIRAYNTGRGALTISTADVTGTTSQGVLARNYGSDLSIDTRGGTVTGVDAGIVALNYGTGVLTVTAADVDGGGNQGIVANNFTGTDLTVTSSGTVTGFVNGIYARNEGSGALTVNAADASGAIGNGVYARNASGTDLSITTTGNTSGGSRGIYARQYGSGALRISATDVSGGAYQGIYALNTGTDLSITTTGVVSGDVSGIEAENMGSGALNVSVAEVSGTTSRGISVQNSGTDLTVIATGPVTGNRDAIFASNRGTRSLTISVADAISANDGYGINARNYGAGALVISADNATGTRNNSGILGSNSGTDLSITTSGLVTSDWRGISANNRGSGALSIVAADVTATRLNGINATNRGTDLSITSTGAISGVTQGIDARNYGNGALTIAVADVAGATDDGIYARNGSTATGLSISTTGAITGGQSGIHVRNDGSGASVIDVSGRVVGGGVAGINTLTGATGLSVITLQQGATVSASSGDAILNDDGNSRVTLAAGSAVAGAVRLNGGEDALTIDGAADIRTASLFDGGAGVLDALTFSSFTGDVDGTLFKNWERLTADNGSALTLDDAAAGFDLVTVQNRSSVGTAGLDFALAGSLRTGPTGRFLAAHTGVGNITIGGDVRNDGAIRLTDGESGDRFNIGGDLSGTGVVDLDVDFATGTSDQITVLGGTAGAQQGLRIGKLGAAEANLQDITLASVSGTNTTSDFQLVGGDFITKSGQGAVISGAYTFLLDHDFATGAFVLSPFGANGDVNRNPDRAFLAAGVQQFSDHLSLNGSLRRISCRTSAASGETVSRSLFDLSTADQPLIWFNAEGGRDSYTVDDRTNDTLSGGLRVGASLPLAEFANGSVIGGLEFGAATLSTTSETALADGKVDTDAYDITLSALWLAGSQLYLDGQLRYAYFDSATRLAGGQDIDTYGNGYATSIEVGKIFALNNGLNLIPQAQVIYSDVDADDLSDVAGGATGTVSDGDRLSIRLGMRADHALDGIGLLYGQLDYFHAFDNETGVSFGNDTVLTQRSRNNLALAIGGYVSVSERTRLFGEISAQNGFDGDTDDYGYAGQIGFEIHF